MDRSAGFFQNGLLTYFAGVGVTQDVPEKNNGQC